MIKHKQQQVYSQYKFNLLTQIYTILASRKAKKEMALFSTLLMLVDIDIQRAGYVIVGLSFGALIHHTIFIHGEWHTQAHQIIAGHAVIAGLLGIAQATAAAADAAVLAWTIALSTTFYGGYLPGITLSILIYRYFFHRLTKAEFPGPWYARLSKIWHVWAARDARNHLVLDEMHRKYGDIVRTGPAEVTVFTPDVFSVIDGPRSTCIKAEFYDLFQGVGQQSIVTTRNREIHDIRRREWIPGFSKSLLGTYRQRISRHMDKFTHLLSEDTNQQIPTDIRKYLYWFGFDAMGDFVFSKSFNLLETKKSAVAIERWQRALYMVGPVSSTPWLLHAALGLLPSIGIIKDFRDTVNWSADQMKQRLDQSSKGEMDSAAYDDLAYYLMEDVTDRTHRQSEKTRSWNLSWLAGDSLLAIIAGRYSTVYKHFILI